MAEDGKPQVHKSCRGLALSLVKCLGESACMQEEKRSYKDCALDKNLAASPTCIDIRDQYLKCKHEQVGIVVRERLFNNPEMLRMVGLYMSLLRKVEFSQAPITEHSHSHVVVEKVEFSPSLSSFNHGTGRDTYMRLEDKELHSKLSMTVMWNSAVGDEELQELHDGDNMGMLNEFEYPTSRGSLGAFKLLALSHKKIRRSWGKF